MIEIIDTDALTVTATKETTTYGKAIKFQVSSEKGKQDVTVLFLHDLVVLVWNGVFNESQDITEEWGEEFGHIEDVDNISVLDAWNNYIEGEMIAYGVYHRY